jgi:hypothetical protein
MRQLEMSFVNGKALHPYVSVAVLCLPVFFFNPDSIGQPLKAAQMLQEKKKNFV